MNSFDDRKKGQQDKYARDQEFEFKAISRRNKLLGLWAANELGLSGDEAESYAKTIVVAYFDKPSEEGIFRKVHGDLQEKGIDVSEHRIRRQVDDLLSEARKQVASE